MQEKLENKNILGLQYDGWKKLIKGHYISFGPLHKAVETKWRQSELVSSLQYLLKTTKNPTTATRSWTMNCRLPDL